MTTATKILAAGLLLLTACQETEYMRFDTSSPGIYFTRDTLKYSFGVLPVETREAEFRFSMRIMDKVSDTDRTFAFEVIADSTTAKEGVQYRLGKPVIPAGKVDGYIPVTLLRDGIAGSYTEGFVHYKLGLRLIAGEGYSPTLGEKDQIRVLTFDNAVEQPSWLDYRGEKIWRENRFGVWHPLKFIKMVEYFHNLQNILPETYVKMVDRYGENLEHVPYGDFYEYGTIMRKYVFIPMYDYFSNPDNRDEILKHYPDFPFDFPKQ